MAKTSDELRTRDCGALPKMVVYNQTEAHEKRPSVLQIHSCNNSVSFDQIAYPSNNFVPTEKEAFC